MRLSVIVGCVVLVFVQQTRTRSLDHARRFLLDAPDPSTVYVRLVGGQNALEGRVDVYAYNQWGSICDDNWNTTDANVVCGMLGYSRSGATPKGQSFYGVTNERIWLDEVRCTGNEQSIASCPSNRWGVNDCSHYEDSGVICVANGLPDNFLLFADSGYGHIFRMDLTTKNYVSLSGNNQNPVAIDYDYINGRVYWTDVVLKQIRSVSINGEEEKAIKTLNKASVADGIAVDSVSRLIFYTDTGNDVIVVMSLDGSYSAEIINTNLDEPRAIIADPATFKIYWSDWGSSPKIESANYDGTNRQQIISTDLRWPNAIAVDNRAGVIYWADGGKETIEKANLDGSNRQLLVHNVQTHYFGLALDPSMNRLFYTDWTMSAVMTLSTAGANNTHFGPGGFQRLMDIHVHRSSYNPTVSNRCTDGNGGCSQICVPTSTDSTKCMCQTGMNLQPDGRTCQ